MPALAGYQPAVRDWRAHQGEVARAIAILETALARGGAIAHAGRNALTAEDARRTLAAWRRVVNQPT
jgi:hypothetical protein